MLCYECISLTDIGNKRKVNQDSFIALSDEAFGHSFGVFCVADGMGGLSEGEYASRLATQKTIEWYKKNLTQLKKIWVNEKKLKESLKTLFFEINKIIYEYGIEKNIKVGTTYSLLLLIGNKYYIVHAGDSRIYLKRNDKLFMLTKDQTWVNDQVDKGFMSQEQADNHPKKNVLANCMGCFENPSICTGEGNVMLNDSFLLCSVGLYNLVTADEILCGLGYENMECAAAEFLDAAKGRGGFDNITLLLVKITDTKETENTKKDKVDKNV